MRRDGPFRASRQNLWATFVDVDVDGVVDVDGDGDVDIDAAVVVGGDGQNLSRSCPTVPSEFGSGSTCYRRFVEWRQAGVFHMMHVEMLLYYDEQRGIDWDWASLDSAIVKAPKGGISRARIRPTARSAEPSATS